MVSCDTVTITALRISNTGVKRWNTQCGHNKKGLHRVDGPAIEYPDGSYAWYLANQLHRADGPAVHWAGDGSNKTIVDEWWFQGRRHRLAGPAVLYDNGNVEWWHWGKRYMNFSEYFAKVPYHFQEERLLLQLMYG